MKNAFARDENGNIKHKQPCQTPGCDYPNWHICLVGKPDTTVEILKKRGSTKGRTLSPRTEEHANNQANAQRERWERVNGERDRKIVEYYKNHQVGYKQVAERFGIGSDAAFRVLKKAEARGEIQMRPRGRNNRWISS